MRTMEQSIHNCAIGLNYVAALMGVFGGVALLLSAIGVYGVMAHLVSDQKRMRSGSGWRSALPQRKVSYDFASWNADDRSWPAAVGLPLGDGFARLMASLSSE